MHGFFGRFLHIRLSEKQFFIQPMEDRVLSAYLGGKGIASHFLSELNPKGVAPLSPDNHLIFATGPACAAGVWGGSRYGVFTKSPQTGFYTESYSGGKTPEAMSATGFDAVVVSGECESPTVLEIHPNGVEFHDAADLWGRDTFETEDIVNERFGRGGVPAPKHGAVVIGPAGENRVRFAVIENDYWRCAGRTGVGAVMGAKKLKAIVFKGNAVRSVHDPDGLRAFSREMSALSRSHPSVLSFKKGGTPKMVEAANRMKSFPTRYWSEGRLEGWERLSAEALHRQCDVTPRACARCFIACGRLSTVRQGRHAGLVIEGPEYETIFAFGGLCLVRDIEEIAYLNDICDRLGMDTISAGNLCGFAIEAARRGRLDYPVDYGDVDAIAELLTLIANRSGVGELLAGGVRAASRELGLTDIAVHVKGLEPPGYDPRVLKGSGLAFAVSDRGACHLRANFHTPEMTGMADPAEVRGKAGLFIDFEDRMTLFDTLILCRFYRELYPLETLARLYHLLTGMEPDQPALRRAAGRIATLVRCYNIREGLTAEDDRLPPRLLKEALPSGDRITAEELDIMKREYYLSRGWGEDGTPDC